MKKKILFRADGNSETGLGHLYRLFALVEMYKNDFEFIFVTKEKSTLKVIPKAYPIHLIPESISIEEEPKWLSKNFNATEFIIIADGYQFVSNYQKKIKELGYYLMYIDDLTTQYMYADIVVNHSPNIIESDFKSEKYTQFALGTDYAILRPLFLKVTNQTKKISKIDTAFVCFGGADSHNLSEKTIDTLLHIEQIEKIKVVFGAAFGKEKIHLLQKKYNTKVQLYNNLSEIELLELMQSCNFAVVPSSTILFELFCVKMPIYSGFFVENQRKAFNYFKEMELVAGFGDFCKISMEEYLKSIQNFINLSKYEYFIDKQDKLFDGNQKKRYLSLIKHFL